jgi:hypothetical protein
MDYKRHWIATILQLIAISLYFTPLFIDEQLQNIHGFKAMQYYWIATLLFILCVLIALIHIIGLLRKVVSEKMEKILVFVINIQIVFSALLITFFSYIVNIYTYIFTMIIIISAYNQYKIKT